jgi:hypothetical protein
MGSAPWKVGGYSRFVRQSVSDLFPMFFSVAIIAFCRLCEKGLFCGGGLFRWLLSFDYASLYQLPPMAKSFSPFFTAKGDQCF